MKNYVKDYLEQPGHSLESLKDELGISSRCYNAKGGDLVILSYSQIDSPKTNPIVRMCRGLVLELNTWNIVSFPFYLFYNFEEVPEERVKFDWKHCYATEKIDGSLLEVFNYKGEWLISTRSTIGGENAVNTLGTTFNNIFDEAIKPFSREQFFGKLANSRTYIFELVSPYNQIVTQWDISKLYLIGGREVSTEKEISFSKLYEDADNEFRSVVRVPNIISLYDEATDDFVGFEKMKLMAETGNAQDEGFVVVDFGSPTEDTLSFPRVKVKNTAYVALHHLRGTLENGTPQWDRILTLIYNHEEDEVLATLPSLRKYFDDARVKWNKFVDLFNEGLEYIKEDLASPEKFAANPALKKEFAMKVQKTKYTNLYFYMLKVEVQTLEQMIEYQIGHSMDVFSKLWENYVSKL